MNDWFEPLSVLLRLSTKTRMWFATHVLYPACLQIPTASEHQKQLQHQAAQQSSSAASLLAPKQLSPYYRFLEFFFECPLAEVCSLIAYFSLLFHVLLLVLVMYSIVLRIRARRSLVLIGLHISYCQACASLHILLHVQVRSMFCKIVAFLASASLNYNDPPLAPDSPLLRVMPQSHLNEFGVLRSSLLFSFTMFCSACLYMQCRSLGSSDSPVRRAPRDGHELGAEDRVAGERRRHGPNPRALSHRLRLVLLGALIDRLGLVRRLRAATIAQFEFRRRAPPAELPAVVLHVRGARAARAHTHA